MLDIPVGEFDGAKIANELYEDDDVRSPIFEEAYRRYPECNFEPQASEAADYIMDRFAERFSDRYSDVEWEAISETLHEHVYAGLT